MTSFGFITYHTTFQRHNTSNKTSIVILENLIKVACSHEYATNQLLTNF